MTAADPPTYAFPENAFAKRRTYRLTQDALTWEEEGATLDGVFYDAIAEVQMTYAPTRFTTNRYRTRIIFRQGGMVNLFNTDYAGIGDFPEKNEDYAAFVRELHKRLAERGTNTVFRKGNSTAAYVLNLALTVFIFAMIALAFVLLFNFGLMWVAVVKLMVVLTFVPVLIRYIRRVRPAEYDPLALPPDAVPEATG